MSDFPGRAPVLPEWRRIWRARDDAGAPDMEALACRLDVLLEARAALPPISDPPCWTPALGELHMAMLENLAIAAQRGARVDQRRVAWGAACLALRTLQEGVAQAAWTRWQTIETGLCIVLQQEDLLATAIVARQALEEVIVAAHEDALAQIALENIPGEWDVDFAVPDPEEIANGPLATYAQFARAWYLPTDDGDRRSTPPPSLVVRRDPQERVRARVTALDAAYGALNELIHPNLGSHFGALFPERLVVAERVLGALVALYQEVLSIRTGTDWRTATLPLDLRQDEPWGVEYDLSPERIGATYERKWAELSALEGTSAEQLRQFRAEHGSELRVRLRTAAQSAWSGSSTDQIRALAKAWRLDNVAQHELEVAYGFLADNSAWRRLANVRSIAASLEHNENLPLLGFGLPESQSDGNVRHAAHGVSRDGEHALGANDRAQPPIDRSALLMVVLYDLVAPAVTLLFGTAASKVHQLTGAARACIACGVGTPALALARSVLETVGSARRLRLAVASFVDTLEAVDLDMSNVFSDREAHNRVGREERSIEGAIVALRDEVASLLAASPRHADRDTHSPLGLYFGAVAHEIKLVDLIAENMRDFWGKTSAMVHGHSHRWDLGDRTPSDDDTFQLQVATHILECYSDAESTIDLNSSTLTIWLLDLWEPDERGSVALSLPELLAQLVERRGQRDSPSLARWRKHWLDAEAAEKQRGDLDGAEVHYREALSTLELLLVNDRRRELYECLAMTQQALGDIRLFHRYDFNGARPFYRAAIEASERTLVGKKYGSWAVSTLPALLHRAAQVELQLGELETARALVDRAVGLLDRVLTAKVHNDTPRLEQVAARLLQSDIILAAGDPEGAKRGEAAALDQLVSHLAARHQAPPRHVRYPAGSLLHLALRLKSRFEADVEGGPHDHALMLHGIRALYASAIWNDAGVRPIVRLLLCEHDIQAGLFALEYGNEKQARWLLRRCARRAARWVITEKELHATNTYHDLLTRAGQYLASLSARPGTIIR